MVVILGVNENNDYYMDAFVLPNEPIELSTPLTEFVVPVEAIERESGLVFFNDLDIFKRKNLCNQVECVVQPFAKSVTQSNNKS
jgi:endonuclease G